MTQQIGNWRVSGQLGVGTVGTVYKVEGTDAAGDDAGRVAALKVLRTDVSEDRTVQARFEREVEILERLSHPNIVAVYDSGRETGGPLKGQLYYVMEFVDGPSLKEVLEDPRRSGRLEWQDAVEIGWQICSALQHAHNQGVVHRDLKPANLFLAKSGTVKLGDFGIAFDTEAAELTATGLTVGTYAFMSPEQIRGDRRVGGAADLYAMGCLLYRMVVGVNPFGGANFAQIFDKHLNDPPPSARDRVEVPVELDRLIRDLLAKTPTARPTNAREVQGRLAEVLLQWDEEQGRQLQERPATWAIDPDKPILSNLIRPPQTPPSKSASWAGIAVLCVLLVVGVTLAAMFGG